MCDLKKLSEPFFEDEYEWRVQSCGMNCDKPWAMVLCYVTNRAIMNRLDDICGPDGWRNEYSTGPEGGVICGLSIWSEIRNQWITKWDGAENTDIEAVKGGLSDAMKRAAVQWGIGRHLYNLKEGFADCSLEKKNGWRSAKTKEGKKIYWNPPKLPDWAVKSDGNTTAPVKSEKAEKPKKETSKKADKGAEVPAPNSDEQAFLAQVQDCIMDLYPSVIIDPNQLRTIIYNSGKSGYPTDLTKVKSAAEWIMADNGRRSFVVINVA